jgi:hypothetical protein
MDAVEQGPQQQWRRIRFSSVIKTVIPFLRTIIKRRISDLKKNTIIVYVLMAIMLLLAFVPVEKTIRIVGMLVTLLLVIVVNRGSLYYSQANKHYQKNTEEERAKSLALYKKAFKAGVSRRCDITIGSVAVQCGDDNFGQTVFESVIKGATKKEDGVRQVAKTAMSMIYWLHGDLDKAIAICEEVIEAGYIDNNVYINYATYCLEKGDLAKFRSIIRDYKKNPKLKSPALSDLYAASLILNGEWAKAGNVITQMLDVKDYQFADPYVHMAQIKLHYGKFDEAGNYLKKAHENCMFTRTAIIKDDVILSLIDMLAEPEKNRGTIAAINKDPLALINGKIPAPIENPILTFDAEPDYKAAEKTETGNTKSVENDNQEPNTDLTEEDEKWLQKHGN